MGNYEITVIKKKKTKTLFTTFAKYIETAGNPTYI